MGQFDTIQDYVLPSNFVLYCRSMGVKGDSNKRAWYSIHRFTYIVLGVLVLSFTILNLRVYKHEELVQAGEIVIKVIMYASGWPRAHHKLIGQEGDYWEWNLFVGNILVLLIILLVAGCFCEYLIRRRARLKSSAAQ